jgi:creatinine amidohydrolase
MATHPGTKIVVHNWWSAPQTMEVVRQIDPVGSHGSWMENFPWNRVAQVPDEIKPPVDLDLLRSLSPAGVKELVGDGNYGGAYQKPDDRMMALWQAGVEETRRVIDGV